MLQVLYLIAFAILSGLVIYNLIGNLITIGREQTRPQRRRRTVVPHPELLDADGNLTDEPLLVIRSTSLDDARSRLDALYNGDDDEGVSV